MLYHQRQLRVELLALPLHQRDPKLNSLVSIHRIVATEIQRMMLNLGKPQRGQCSEDLLEEDHIMQLEPRPPERP